MRPAARLGGRFGRRSDLRGRGRKGGTESEMALLHFEGNTWNDDDGDDDDDDDDNILTMS